MGEGDGGFEGDGEGEGGYVGDGEGDGGGYVGEGGGEGCTGVSGSSKNPFSYSGVAGTAG